MAIHHLSELYCRYNGFMFGFVQTANRFKYAAARYPIHRRRMNEVLDELGIELRLPQKRSQYIKHADALVQEISSSVAERSEKFWSFMFLGSIVHDMAHVRADIDPEMIENAEMVALAVNVWPELQEFVRNIKNGEGKVLSIDDALSQGYKFLEMIIQMVRAEPKTCFVIMPFAEPFATYYSIFYRPMLAQMGYRAIRAWDGLSGEFYVNFLVALTGKCGAALADLSREPGKGIPNLNVVHEIGIFEGRGKPVFITGERGRFMPPGNHGRSVGTRYSPKRKDWPEGDIMKSATAFSIQLAAPALSKIDFRNIKPLQGG